jgi:hypothetical protein
MLPATTGFDSDKGNPTTRWQKRIDAGKVQSRPDWLFVAAAPLAG